MLPDASDLYEFDCGYCFDEPMIPCPFCNGPAAPATRDGDDA